MAIYHLHVKVIGRKSGASAVASAAYRSGSRLRDHRIERSHDFTAKRGVIHSEVMLPDGAPEHWSDRERLWNDVEAFEVRKDAQLAREVEFAIPREMTESQGIALARDFVQSEFVDRGMVADLNLHWDIGEDGMPKPHAHVMLTMRSVERSVERLVGQSADVDEERTPFGPKVREWNRTEMVERWRVRWAELANERLAELDIDARIDHRSLEAQGIALEPQSQIGAPAQRLEARCAEARGIEQASEPGIKLASDVADRAELHREIARNNGERIIADPSLALDAITHQQSTFTRRDMAKFAHRHSDGIDQFNDVMGAIANAPDLVELGTDRRGVDRFTTRQMIETEQRLHLAADRMAEESRHLVSDKVRLDALARAEQRGLSLSNEQADALSHVTDARSLGIVVGHAGTGKSAMLGVARDAWQASGFEVRGVALSGIAAENLQSGSGIASRTIASMEHGWGEGRGMLSPRDVLVIDEAGMVGTRQLERVLSHAVDAGAKVVLVGDPQQLQSIEAGAAFRSLHERHGGVEIGTVRRQREDWQRDATRDLATGKIDAAISTYDRHGMVHGADSRLAARASLIERWDEDRQAEPDRSRIILTHTNDEVRALNESARARMRDAGDLGEDVRITVDRGARDFASGDRVMFLQNERGLGGDGVGVKNGTLGTIEDVSTRSMTVRTDDGRSIAFDLKDYDRIDHGYAATIHKAQGMTVDRTHVLATPGLDAHGSYVALSRHRDGMELHYGRDDFATQDKLIRTLSRDRAKDMASDYMQIDPAMDPARDYAERRGIAFRQRVIEIVRRVVPETIREAIRERIDGLIEGLRLPDTGVHGDQIRQQLERGTERAAATGQVPEMPAPVLADPQTQHDSAEDVEEALRRARTQALIRHARAIDAILTTGDADGNGSPEQMCELNDARKSFEDVRPYGWRDAEAGYVKNPEFVSEAARGNVNRAVRALQLETEIRTGPQRRADLFVERWQKLHKTSQRQYQDGDISAYKATRSAMADMAKGLERDPQMESLLANRKAALGIEIESGRRLGVELAFNHGIGLGRGRGLELQ
ncbi:Ti-type conjugative transfer relaxase TraA [Georhizobium profundi]|uniref:Ti-type conjugative transfer relaxase TraA n=1 Tax=Georhizobium profundi TaxID=2341112 RepID=A0A3S9BAK4_9HYPH|nr:Ti-type conjugative transfer relaxase TraA [Georhizobium profundi]AZN73975.1 Ti-type conjugative transfer relaxase TraA [Georhizobium profundi]